MLHDAQCEAPLVEHHVGRAGGCYCADRVEARLTALTAAMSDARVCPCPGCESLRRAAAAIIAELSAARN